MKKILTFLLLLSISVPGLVSACTCDPWATSFRNSLMRMRWWYGDADSSHYVLKARTISYDQDTRLLRFQVLQQYRGSTDLVSDTITYDGNGTASCFDNFAAYLPVGDTAVISVFQMLANNSNPPVDSGTFKNYYCEINYMRIVNDSVVGWPWPGTGFPAEQLQDSMYNFYHAPVSVQDLSRNDNIKLAPNPGRDYIRVSLSGVALSAATIFDLNGRPLVQQTISGDDAIINTRLLPAGSYMLLLTDKQGNSYRRKWTKQ